MSLAIPIKKGSQSILGVRKENLLGYRRLFCDTGFVLHESARNNERVVGRGPEAEI